MTKGYFPEPNISNIDSMSRQVNCKKAVCITIWSIIMCSAIRKRSSILWATIIKKWNKMCSIICHLPSTSKRDSKIRNIFSFWGTIIRGQRKYPKAANRKESTRNTMHGLLSLEKIATVATALRCVWLSTKSRPSSRREKDTEMAVIALSSYRPISNVLSFISRENSIFVTT